MNDIQTSRFFNGLLIVLLAAVVIYYGLVHWRVIWMVEPATLRESAWIANINGFLDPTGPRPYTLQSFPGHTNVYGIGYLFGAAPFAALLQFGEWANLRIGNAFYLGLLLFTLGYGCRTAPTHYRVFSLVLVYALFVSSPSIAACPDILACVLYVLAWVLVAESEMRPRVLCLSILIGFLALLTKLYLVLVIPAIGIYLLLFRSLRSGVLYMLGTLGFFGTALWLVHLLYPNYFISVFALPLVASRYPMVALKQWGEFLILVPVLFLIAVPPCWRWLRTNVQSLRLEFKWTSPLVQHRTPVSLYAWGALVSAAALAVSLSWHGGAHMIYFWHLLLPLLVLAQLRQPSVHIGWLCINLLLLLLLRPPLPATGTPEVWRMLQEIVANHPRTYLDPFTASLRPASLGNANRENALSDCIVDLEIATTVAPGKNSRATGGFLARALVLNEDPLLKRAEQFVHEQQREFTDQLYDRVLLTEVRAFHNDHLLPTVSSRYKVTAGYYVYSYYLNFRNRLDFGRYPIRVLLLERKELHAAPSPSGTPAPSYP